MEKSLFIMNSRFESVSLGSEPDRALTVPLKMRLTSSCQIFNDISVITTRRKSESPIQVQKTESFQLELENRFQSLGSFVDEYNDGFVETIYTVKS